MVTGATSGIGQVTALELARMDATVVIVARDQKKADATVAHIKEETGNPAVEALLADFSSLDQVRALAEAYQRRHQHLHVLVNNAGAMYFRRKVSADGFEMTFAVNHLAPFLLTNLLLETIRVSTPARIVNVASNSHFGAQINFEDLSAEQSYRPMRAYGQSKLANVMFSYELARRLDGGGVTANTLHPGFVATGMGSNNGRLVKLFLPLMRLFALSPEKGAQTSLYLATSAEVEGVSGDYFFEQRPMPSSPASHDREAAQRLWQVSAEMTGLK
jgi:NAD(P)-dependent dehydrogenase (short-subunit alcohol dehydrogenase family)